MIKTFSYFIIRTGVLFLFWIALSGKLDPFHLTLGLFSAMAVAALAEGLFGAFSGSNYLNRLPHILLAGILYLFWLLTRIILAAIHVSKVILNPKLPINPHLIPHKTILQDDYSRVIFANSITLTPGTITADIEGSDMVVHALDEDSASDIVSGAMEKQIAKILETGEGGK